MKRELDFRYKILRNGADFGWVTSPENAGNTLRMNSADPVKRALSARFLPHKGVNWLTDEIAPYLIVDGRAHALGVFAGPTVAPRESDGTETEAVEAYDRSWYVKSSRTETILHFAAGSNYITVVEQLLTASGIKTVLATPTAETLQSDREDWDVGTSRLEIVNTLLREINYNQLWFDAAGVAVLEPATVPKAANIDHRLKKSDVRSLIYPQLERETDVYDAPNVFICICQNPDYPAPLTAVSENNNVQSPLSIPRRGRRIVEVEYLDNIASQAALQIYTDRKRDMSMIRGETVKITTGLLPGYGVNDVTALEYGSLSAITRERAWTMQLQVGGTMKHVLERMVYNLE